LETFLWGFIIKLYFLARAPKNESPTMKKREMIYYSTDLEARWRYLDIIRMDAREMYHLWQSY